MATAGEFKQQILQVYNAVHQSLFGLGLRRQSVELISNKVIIVDVNPRAPVLKTLADDRPDLVSITDEILLEAYKRQFSQELRDRLQLNIVAILKDYDAATEYSGTIILLDRDVSCYYE